MATTPQYLAGIEGFDAYVSGAFSSSNYPWTVYNTTYTGSISGTTGAFGTNSLAFAVNSANGSGLCYQFPSTMSPIKAGTVSQVFSWNGWISVGSTSNVATDTLLALCSSSTPSSGGFAILGLSYSSTTGLNLLFPSTLAAITTSPYTYAIAPNTYYWVSIIISIVPGTVTATYAIGGTNFQTAVGITWPADYFTTGQIANMIRFCSPRVATVNYDDMVVQAVSSSDSSWPGGTISPSTIPQFQPQKVTNAIPVSNGSIIQWSASGSEPNYQSATDITGANTVLATATSETDLYNWTAVGVTNVKALCYRGNSTRYGNITPQKYVSSVQSAFQTVTFAPSRFVALSENDGTNAWTAASIAAASFGQESH